MITLPLPVLAFLVFALLRLVGVLDWSWWLITLPLWFQLISVLAYLAGFGAGLQRGRSEQVASVVATRHPRPPSYRRTV